MRLSTRIASPARLSASNSSSSSTAPCGMASRPILQLRTALEVATPEEITTQRLIGIRGEIAAISDAITTQYFS